jgi:hypothetical protein
MSETKTVLCGRCHIAVEERANSDGQVMAVCPTCGESDTVENAVGEAADYLTDKIAREAMAPFENMPSTNFMKVMVTHSPQRTYRFILADQTARWNSRSGLFHGRHSLFWVVEFV